MNKYVIILLFLLSIRPSGPVVTKITQKAHIVNNLKANMLISMNMMDPKAIDITPFMKTAFISSC